VQQIGRVVDEVLEMVLVGNTAMHHLFLGLPVAQLALAPYVPAASMALDRKARDLGLRFALEPTCTSFPTSPGMLEGIMWPSF